MYWYDAIINVSNGRVATRPYFLVTNCTLPHTLHILPRFLKACTHCTPALCTLSLLAIITTTNLTAQPVVDTIRANPGAVQLRRVWTITGQPGDQIGEGIGSVGDINGDGINDVACYSYGAIETRIYFGDTAAIKTSPSAIIKGYALAALYHPVTGRFFRGSRQVLVLESDVMDTITVNGNQTTAPFRRYYFFHVDSGRIDTLPFVELDTRRMVPRTNIDPSEVLAADLDGDGSDELIIYTSGAIRGTVLSRVPEVWIYRGGPGFQVDTPTVILHDTEENGGSGTSGMFVADVDGDKHLDLVTNTDYKSQPNLYHKLKFWFGTPGSPWSWTAPEHEVVVTAQPGFLPAADFDGDGITDYVLQSDGLLDKVPDRTRLYLSKDGKSIRNRPMDIKDADRIYYAYETGAVEDLGFISDSLRRYSVLGISNPVGFTPRVLGLSGGPAGPDANYDAYLSGSLWIYLQKVGDVTGDGWDDLMAGDPNSGNSGGFATIIAGGPYIPRDPSLGVREIPVTGEDKPKLFCWPVPMHNQLNIAWHGTMKRFPARFAVHDAIGRLVATGSVEPYQGAALWQAGPGITPGTYILSVYDHNGILLGTQKIIKM